MFYVLLATRALLRERGLFQGSRGAQSRRAARSRRARYRRRRREPRPDQPDAGRAGFVAHPRGTRATRHQRALRRRRARSAASDELRPGLRRRPSPQRGRTAFRHDASAFAASSPTPMRRRRRSRRSSTGSIASAATSNRRCRKRRSPPSRRAAQDAAEDRRLHAVPVRRRVGTRAWSGSSRAGSRTAITAPPSSSREERTASSRAPGDRSRVSICAMRSISPSKRSPGLADQVRRSRVCRRRHDCANPTCARFAAIFESIAREHLTPADLARTIDSDGTLAPGELGIELAAALRSQVWGQGFPAPLFDDTFSVLAQRIVGGSHSKLALARGGERFDAILFRHVERASPVHPRRLSPGDQRVAWRGDPAARHRALADCRDAAMSRATRSAQLQHPSSEQSRAGRGIFRLWRIICTQHIDYMMMLQSAKISVSGRYERLCSASNPL